MEQGRVFELAPSESVHDLEGLAEEVRREYFPGVESLPVQWGRKIGRKRRQSIRLGSYDRSGPLIRIHPLLDSLRVPSWFIQSIIHHEYLHHILGPRHNHRFQRYERAFRYNRESKIWLQRYLPVLLGRSRPRPIRKLHRSHRAVIASPSVTQTALW